MCCLAVLLSLGVAATATANETGGDPRCVGSAPTLAAAYNEAFGRPLGNWQAGDVPHSYPLPDGSVLWIFNDSFLNTKNPSAGINGDSIFVRNVAVKQIGRCFEVVAGPTATANEPTTTTTTTDPLVATTRVKPTSFLATGERKDQVWWWFHGGDVDGDYLHIFVTEMHQTGAASWGIAFEPAAIALATYNWHTLEFLDLRPAPNAGTHPGYGFSVANDDSFTYLFGQADNLQFTRADRRNYVARVPLHQVYSPPTYWNGSNWVDEAAQAVSISTEGSWDHRMTVMHQDDRWIATAKEDDFFGDEFLVLEAPQPQGPWVITQRIPVAPLSSPADGVTYDGLALPRIVDGRIIVSWSNNQYDFARVAPQPRLYRPTFADVTLGAPTQSNVICHQTQGAAVTTPLHGRPGKFKPLAPQRILDTRETGNLLGAGDVRQLDVASALQIPPGQFDAVVLNVTMVDARAPGFVTVWPGGVGRPQTSNLNADHAGATVADVVTTSVDATGFIQIYSSASAHVIIDVSGIYVAAAIATDGRFVAVPPTRLMDSRAAGPVLPARRITTLALSGQVVLPARGVSAVVLNVTSTAAAAAGFVTVWPTGARPTASNLNVERGMTRANQVIVPVGQDGAIRLYNDSSMHLIVDVSGYYTAADAPSSSVGLFVATAAIRLLDSRQAAGIPGTGCIARVVVPASASAAVTTLTLVDGHKAGFATMWPGGQSRPNTSTVNLDAPGQTRPNHAIVGLDANRALQLYLEPRAHALVDLSGYFT